MPDNNKHPSTGNQTATDRAPEKQTDADTPPDTRDRLDPTRYGDWEKRGRCIDF